jgi:methylenetetrahydrofolate--tRNA-(uracil-5-)-methyltransferase
VACGPLPSEPLSRGDRRAAGGKRRSGARGLHYYDAASPIVATESLDLSQMYEKSRYDKGDGADYLNIPLDREQYATLRARSARAAEARAQRIRERRGGR